jgi:F-type H+-transporting ATPase subunit epsilon
MMKAVALNLGGDVVARVERAREEIDIERALAAKKRAEERIAIVERKAEDIDIERARASLMRALLRIEVANKRRTT